MAYVGCMAGAMPIEEYERLLDGGRVRGGRGDRLPGKDLNAYAKVEGQSGCCSPAMAAPATGGDFAAESLRSSGIGESQSCCGAEPPAGVHAGLADVLERYDVNEYAASVRVYAVRPAADFGAATARERCSPTTQSRLPGWVVGSYREDSLEGDRDEPRRRPMNGILLLTSPLTGLDTHLSCPWAVLAGCFLR